MNRFFPHSDRYIAGAKHPRIAIRQNQISGAPTWMHSLRICFITDIHLHNDTDLDCLLTPLTHFDGDLILFGGDFADHREDALRFISALGDLHPQLGTYAVPGNNDREAFSDLDELDAVLKQVGIKLLVNCAVDIPLAGGTLVLGGVDEYRYGSPHPERLFSEKSAANYKILLSHYPIMPDLHAGLAPDLMLAGHTHGGQFNAFGMTPYSIGFERLIRRRLAPVLVSGMAHFGGTTVLVSKGIGMSRIPLRVGVQPEVHYISFVC